MSEIRFATGDYKKNQLAPMRHSKKIGTSVTRMKLDRTSIIVVVMKTGVLNDDDTDESTVFSKDDMGSDDLDPGSTMCLFPFESESCLPSQSLEQEKKDWHQPVINLTILFLTLPLGVDSSTSFISLKSRKSLPLLTTKISLLSSSAPRTFSETSKLSHELTPRATKYEWSWPPRIRSIPCCEAIGLSFWLDGERASNSFARRMS